MNGTLKSVLIVILIVFIIFGLPTIIVLGSHYYNQKKGLEECLADNNHHIETLKDNPKYKNCCFDKVIKMVYGKGYEYDTIKSCYALPNSEEEK